MLIYILTILGVALIIASVGIFVGDVIISKRCVATIRDYFESIQCNETLVGYNESLPDIERFFERSPNGGNYITHLKKVSNQAITFLRRNEFKMVPSKTIIFDIDDTLVYTDQISENKTFPRENHPEYGLVSHYPAIGPMVKLLKNAEKEGYFIVIITARPPEAHYNSLTNLKRLGIEPGALFTSLYWGQDPKFKAIMRNNIEHFTPSRLSTMSSEDIFRYNPKNSIKSIGSCKIIMTVGDKWHDVDGMNNVLGLKLPEPSDMNSYFWFNDDIRVIN